MEDGFDLGQSNAAPQVEGGAEDVLGGRGESVMRTAPRHECPFDVRLQQLFVSVTAPAVGAGAQQNDFEYHQRRRRP